MLSETDLSAAAGGLPALPEKPRPSLRRTIPFLLLSVALHVLALRLAFGVVVRPPTPAFPPALTVDVREPAPRPGKFAQTSRREPPNVTVRSKPAALAGRPAKAAAPPLRETATAATAHSSAVPPQPSRGPAEPLPAAPTPGPGSAARFDADYLHNPQPVYPIASRRLGEEGRVLLRVRVSAQGWPAEVDVKQSSGFPRLDQAARAAVQRWRFVPARQGTEAVEASVLVPLQFTLDS
ncbi:TonB family protein [Accumulibacter sp.]|uniref:energy transducer TonB n=1 Tax=Accumulibacter sp. TaxID=2053492 RepID=UPI002636D4BA|nr:TonB family protein [Accumulibacter sp.]